MRSPASIPMAIGYYGALVLFAVLAFSLNCTCLVAGCLPTRRGVERFFQRMIHWHFAVFVVWLRETGLVLVRYEGFDEWPRADGLVVVANHPGLLDIGFLLARIPTAVTVYKPAVGHNPMFGASARRAGYIAGDAGHHLLRDAAAKVSSGYTLIIFPEGTRTRVAPLNALKPGFVAIARMARAPIQLVHIDCDSTLLTKDGPPWWRVPPLPARITVRVGPCIPPPGEDDGVGPVMARIEAWLRNPA